MCGIAGIYLKNPEETYMSAEELDSLADCLLIGNEVRGKHSTGIAAMDKWGITSIEKADLPASEFVNWRRPIMPEVQSVILHTRFATQGTPKNLLNNHPIEYGNSVVVHNGHISNDFELFIEEEFDRIAEVDSEIIAALLNKYWEDDPKLALEKMQGGFAISAFDRRYPGTMLWAKGPSSPFVYMETRGAFIWASLPEVIKNAMGHALGYEVKDDELKQLPYASYAIINGSDMTINDFDVSFKTYSFDNKKHATGWSNPYQSSQPYGAYQGYGAHGDELDICDGCFKRVGIANLKKIGWDFFCQSCELRKTGKRTISKREAKRLKKREERRARKAAAKAAKNVKASKISKGSFKSKTVKTDSLSEKLNDEHWVVCELVAEYYGTKPSFVDYILFSDDDILEIDDPNIATIYIEFDEKYKEFMEMVVKSDDLSRFEGTLFQC